jgi:PAS domain S-box-containing protein
MTLPSLRHWYRLRSKPSHRSRPQIPLRLALTLPFVLLTVGTTGLVGYLSWRNGQQSIQILASQLMNEISDRVYLYLDNFLATPHLVNRLNANAVRLGQVDITNPESLQRHFIQQLQTFDSVSRIHFSNPQGGYLATGLDERGLTVATTDRFLKGTLRVYAVDNQGNRQELLVEQPNYDASQRPFYRAAIQGNQPVWTSVYVYVPTSRGAGLSASYPLYDATQQLQGVLSTDLTLSAIHQFLKGLRIGTDGTVFILDRSGLIIASALDSPSSTQASYNEPRKAIDSQEPAIRLAGQQIVDQLGHFSHINSATQLQFNIAGKQQFLQVTPFQDEFGLDWLIVVTVPETAFTGQIQANTRMTLLFSLAALLGSIALGLWLSRSIARSIRRLGQSSVALADGAWDRVISQDSTIAELQVLNTSFDRMAAQLQQSFNQVKEALQDHETRFQQLATASPAIIYSVLENSDGSVEYEYLSAAFEDIYEVAIAEVQQDTTIPFYQIHPDDRATYQHVAKHSVETMQPFKHEWRIITPSGKIKWLQASSRPERRQAGVVWHGVCLDITDRKQAEEALRQSEARWQRIVSAAPGAIYTFVKRLDQSFYFEYISPAIEAINELTVEQMLQEPAPLLIHPDDQASYDAAVAHSAERLEAFSHEFRIITPAGKLKWLYASSRPERRENGEIAWYGIVLDISDHKQAEEALRQSEERWQLAISGSNDGIWDHDLQTNTHYLSPRCMDMLGYSYDEIDTFDKWVQYIHPDDLTRLQATFQAHVNHQLPSYACEYRMRCKDGSYKWLLARGQVLWDEHGVAVRAVGSLTDITDRKLAEAALRHSEARLHSLTSAAPVAIYSLVQHHDGSLEFEYINRVVEEFHEVSLEEFTADPSRIIMGQMHPDDRQGYIDLFNRSAETLERFQYEWRILPPSGKLKWLQARSQPERRENGDIYWHGVVLDITDRKLAEAALQHSEARFKKIAAASPAQIYIFACQPDGSHRRFKYISPGIREIQELEPEQVLDNPRLTYEQIHPDDRQAYDEVANRSIQALKPFSHEWRIVTASGKLKWVQANSRPEQQPDGEIIWYGVMLDITDRKLAEAALRHSEAALRRAQQVAHVGSWEVDVATDQVTWSEESFHIFGWDVTQPEPTLSRFYDLIHPDDRPSLQQAVSRISTQGGTYKIEFRALQPDGSIRYVEARGEGIKDKKGHVVRLLGTNLDITERQQAEAALRHSEATKNQILKAIPDLIIWLTADGTCIDFMDGGSVTNLYVKSDAIGRNVAELLPPHLAQLRMNAIQQVLQTGEVQIYEQAFMIQDTIRHEEVRVIGVGDDRILVIVRDITDRKQAEAALLDSETRFRSAFWNAPIGMALIGLDDRWIKINPVLCQMLGYTEPELLSMQASALVHPDDLNQLQDSLLQLESDTKPNAQIELRYHCCNGQMIWGLVNLSVVRDAQGQPLYYVAQIQDITERQAIDRIKNEFISIVSHELRTPLTAIRGFLGLLDTGIYDNKPDKAKHMITQALTNSDRLVRLVNDILDLERLSSGRVQLVMEACLAETLLQQAVAGVQSIADQAHITLVVGSTTATVWAAPDSIIQTLTNLLGNAIKFSPDHSVITLAAQAQADSVLFSVTDQGRGIPPDKLETIFGRFQQVDVSDSRQKGGTGLGLAICQSIIQQHGGNIWAESTLGVGSTFYFTLPFPPGGLHE